MTCGSVRQLAAKEIRSRKMEAKLEHFMGSLSSYFPLLFFCFILRSRQGFCRSIFHVGFFDDVGSTKNHQRRP